MLYLIFKKKVIPVSGKQLQKLGTKSTRSIYIFSKTNKQEKVQLYSSLDLLQIYLR